MSCRAGVNSVSLEFITLRTVIFSGHRGIYGHGGVEGRSRNMFKFIKFSISVPEALLRERGHAYPAYNIEQGVHFFSADSISFCFEISIQTKKQALNA